MAQIGKGHAFSLKGALIDKATGAYYATRVILNSCRIRLSGEWTEIKDQTGEINSFITSGDALEAVFEVIPQGATQILAFAGASLPPRGTDFDATGFGTNSAGTLTRIPMGPFLTDGFNNDDTNLQEWYFYDGEVTATNTGHWTAQWTMRRYFNVSGAAVAT